MGCVRRAARDSPFMRFAHEWGTRHGWATAKSVYGWGIRAFGIGRGKNLRVGHPPGKTCGRSDQVIPLRTRPSELERGTRFGG
jgi:hypothetical protein